MTEKKKKNWAIVTVFIQDTSGSKVEENALHKFCGFWTVLSES